MNKFFFLMIMFGIASAISLGILAPDIDLILQKVGIFHKADVGLAGCTCVYSSPQELAACQAVIALEPLCQITPAP